MARRYDTAQLGKAVRTDAGFLRAPATLTRVGVFPYRQADGTIRRELRPPEEVFRSDSLDSLLAAPLTLEHPPEAVNPRNVRTYQVGSVGTDVRPDGELVAATVMVTAAEAIAAVDEGRMQELSCGYDCRLDETPGVWNGERYDAVQRGIVYNHVALVPMGRAGPQVRLHLDAADAVMVSREDAGDPHKEKQMTRTIRIDGVDFEVPISAAQAFEARMARQDAQLAELRTKLDEAEAERQKADEEKSKLEAEKDALEEELEKEKAEKQDALKPERIRELVSARVALETTGREILGSEFKADAADEEIKRAVVLKLCPTAKLDGKDAAYITARFDQAVEQLRAAPNPQLVQLRAGIEHAGGTRTDAASRRDEMLKRNAEAWQRPLTARKGA